jgi:hypothetical protein
MSQGHGDGSAQSPGSSGDQRDLPLQTKRWKDLHACELTSRLRGAAPPLGTCFSEPAGGASGGPPQDVECVLIGTRSASNPSPARPHETKAVRLALYEERKPTLIIRLNSENDTVMAVRIDDGLITGLYAVRNPEKLSHMGRETVLRR